MASLMFDAGWTPPTATQQLVAVRFCTYTSSFWQRVLLLLCGLSCLSSLKSLGRLPGNLAWSSWRGRAAFPCVRRRI